MNKIISLLLAFIAISNYVAAQISFSVKDSADWALNSDFDYNLSSYLQNDATDNTDTLFEWNLTGLDKPSEWDVTVCSGELCIVNPTTPYRVTIPKGDKMNFKLGFSFYNTTGDASAWIVTHSVKNPSIRDSFRLKMRAGTLSLERVNNKITFDAYPNPVVDKMTVSFSDGGTRTILIYDILGSLKKSEHMVSGSSISLADLPKGIYVIKLEGGQSFSKLLHKL